MSVSIDRDTVVKGLWTSKNAQPSVLSNGRFLQLHLDDSSSVAHSSGKLPVGVSCFTFHPADEAQAVLGTTTGHLYGLSLRENKVFLLLDVGNGKPVHAVSFCGPCVAGGGAGRDGLLHVVSVSEGNVVTFVDWHTAVVIHQMQCSAHSRAITSLAAMPPVAPAGEQTTHSQLVVLVSADAVSCWVHRHTRDHGEGHGRQFYMCVGNAVPTQRTLATHRVAAPEVGNDVTNTLSRKQAAKPAPREVHRFLSAHVDKAFVYTTETNGVVAKWSIPPESFTWPSSTAAMKLDRCVRTLPFRASCSACCPAFLALGCRDMAAVALLNTETMEGLGVFHITRDEESTKASSAPVQQVSIVGSELVCCTLVDGRVVCVAASSHQCMFTLHAPSAGITSRFCVPLSWRFVPSGPTYGVYFAASDCVWVHLPTAKAHHDRCQALYNSEEGPRHLAGRGGGTSPSSHVRSRSHVDANAGEKEEEGEEAEEGDVLTFTVKVVPFLTQRRESSNKPASPPMASTVGLSSSRRSSAETRRRLPRKPLVFPKETTRRGSDAANPRARWIDVNAAADANAERPHSAGGAPREEQRALSVVARALYHDSLSDAACAYNVDMLRQYLNTYGVFPKDFRPAIWRFVLGLPERKRTAPQFASLARRRPHSCVATHMEPFPLPPSPARSAVEECISVLAHHAPVFAIADFTPAFVFPFLHVFSPRDTQSIVEVLLLFFRNWGRDFFQCYPQPPMNLLHFMERRLAVHDPALAAHFGEVGCGPEVWCWQPILSLYTDILTGPEWLQVMDHAFLQEPMWLYMFHLAALLMLKPVFLRQGSGLHDVMEILSTPFSQQRVMADGASGKNGCDEMRPSGLVAGAIELAYHLYAKCPRDAPLMADYFAFTTLESPAYAYPTEFPVDPDIMEAKMAELYNLELKRHEERHAAERLQQMAKEAEKAAVREEVALQQQRARIAAKYDTSSETWRARVALEKARQEREVREREMRMEALRSHVATAEELDRIRDDMTSVDVQTRNDMVDRLVEQHKWTLARGMTAAEMERLERDAAERVTDGFRRLMSAPANQTPRDTANEREHGEKCSAATQLDSPATERSSGSASSSNTATSAINGTQVPDDNHVDGGNAGPDIASTHALPNEHRNTSPPASHERVEQYGDDENIHATNGGVAGRYVQLQEMTERPMAVLDPCAGHDETAALAAEQDKEEEDEEDMAAYHNHDEYPPQEELETYLYPELPNDGDGEEDDDDGDRGVVGDSATIEQGRPPRAAPLPTHLAPFVPSSELLKALQSYRRPDLGHQARGEGRAEQHLSPSFLPDTRSVVNPFLEHFQALQHQAENVSGVAESTAPAWSLRHLPTSLKDRLANLRGGPPLFDNLSDDPTPPTTTTSSGMATTTTTTTTTTNIPHGDRAARLPHHRQGPHRAATATATLTTTATRTSTATTATAATTEPSESPSSSAAAALQRPWREQYSYHRKARPKY